MPRTIPDIPFLTDRGMRALTLLVWGLIALVISVMVWHDPYRRTVVPTYRAATQHWWTGQDLYTPGIAGFLYFPQAAILFTPFALLPEHGGDVAWRCAGLALLAWSFWRLARLLDPGGGAGLFPLLTLLAIPAGLGSANSGQANIPLAALLVHATVDVSRRHWWRAGLALGLAVVCKPPAVVLPLLMGAALLLVGVVLFAVRTDLPGLTRRQAVGGVARLALVGAALAALPWLAQHPLYVWRQHVLCFGKLAESGSASLEQFQPSDLSGLLWVVGITVPQSGLWLLRLIAGLATLGLAVAAVRRWPEPHGALALLGLGAAYLMVFSPRTETHTYIVATPVMAAWAGYALFVERRYPRAAGLAAACLICGLSNNIFRPLVGVAPALLEPALRQAARWMDPLACLLFLLWLAYAIAANRPPGTAAETVQAPRTTLAQR